MTPRGLHRILAATLLTVSTASCSLGIGEDRVNEFPMLIRGHIYIQDAESGDPIGGRWTSATELHLGPTDAHTLGIPETIPMNSQERAPSISIDLETDWIVNDIGTSPLYCLTDPIHLVDPTQDSQHTIAGAGDCFRHDIAFRYSADIHPGE